MSRKEFNRLTDDARIRLIINCSLHLITIHERFLRRDLYSLNDFFVEDRIALPACDMLYVKEVKGAELDKFLNRIQLPK